MRIFFSFLLLCGVILGTGCGGKSAVGVSVDSQFRPLIPPNATVLAGVDLKRLKQSALYQRYRQLLDDERLNDLSKQLGVDVRRDVLSVLIAESVTGRLVLIRGEFAEGRLKDKLHSAGARQTNYKGHILFGDQRNVITFLQSGLIAAGSAESIHEAVDRTIHGGGSISAALQKRLAMLPKDESAWVVSSEGLPLLGAVLTQDAQSMLSNLEGFITGVAAGVSADSGLRFEANLQCISEEGAHRVHDAVKGGIGLARLTTNDNALDMLRLYDSIKVNKDGQNVYLKADLPADLVSKIAAHFPQIVDRVNRRLGNRQ